jgi:hypothetical protein
MTYKPVDIVALVAEEAPKLENYAGAEHIWVEIVTQWRNALVAELERLADQPLDLYPTWFAASNLAYRHAVNLIRGEPVPSQTSNNKGGNQ